MNFCSSLPVSLRGNSHLCVPLLFWVDFVKYLSDIIEEVFGDNYLFPLATIKITGLNFQSIFP